MLGDVWLSPLLLRNISYHSCLLATAVYAKDSEANLREPKHEMKLTLVAKNT